MGNEDKVKNPIVESKKAFLRDELSRFEGSAEVYSLEDEFAKTKKNKSAKMPLLILLFVILLGAVAFFIALQANKRAQKVEIGISEFQDMNLVELLSASQDSETKLKSLQIELSDLEAAKTKAIADANENTARQIELIRNRSLSAAERDRQIAQATAAGEAQVRRITEDYDARIAQKRDEIETAQKKAEEQKLEAMDAAQRQQHIADNYQRLYDIKMQEQAKMYEDRIRDLNRQHQRDLDKMDQYYKQLTAVLILKYNPVFKADLAIKDKTGSDLSTIDAALADARSFASASSLSLYPYAPELSSENIMGSGDFAGLRQRMQFYGALADRMGEIPFTNGNVPALANMRSLYRSITADYDMIYNELIGRVRLKNQLIGQYLYALNSYSKVNRDSGYVIDPRDRNNIVVFIQDVYHINPAGTPAIVFRGDNQFIANVKILPTATGYKAAIVDMPDTNRILPLDKILLQLQEGQ